MNKRGNLSSRLSRLKKESLSSPVKGVTVQKITDLESPDFCLPGWELISPFVWRRIIKKKNPLRDLFHNSLLLPEGTKSEELIFYDTETTGLSTGAGTIPFLIGLGRIRENKFEIIQYFLADYPGEPALLRALKIDFPEDSFYVSYNGKSYDSHLINTRFLINRIVYNKGREVDLLYMSRSLWKNKLENCKLGTIEENILDIDRGPDIPGSEIPDVWFDFLKSSIPDRLKLVFSHNLQDIYSLALLLEKIESITEEVPPDEHYDALNLAKKLLPFQREKGIELLIREYRKGNRAASQFLSLHYKREGDWSRAIELWKKLNHNGLNLFATVELAKYYEHRNKDPERALRLVNTLLKSPFAPQGVVRDKMLYRQGRLLRKTGISS